MRFTTLALHGGGKTTARTGDVVPPVHLVKLLQNTLGNPLDPAGAYLLERSVKTLALRLEKQCANAAAVVDFLQAHPKVKQVFYPSIGEENRRIQESQSRGNGAVLSFTLRDSCDPGRFIGGQQQRAAIARALGMRPDVLLFDEPTSALDPELEREVLNVIRTLVLENNTMIIVTHNLLFAREVADFIAFLDGGEVAARGTPKEIFGGSVPKRISDFIAAMSPVDYAI